jgi:hypothetical protein
VNALIFMLLSSSLVTSQVLAFSGDDLRALLSESERYHAERSQDVLSDQTHRVLEPLKTPVGKKSDKKNEQSSSNQPSLPPKTIRDIPLTKKNTASSVITETTFEKLTSNPSINPPTLTKNTDNTTSFPEDACSSMPPSWCDQEPVSQVKTKSSSHKKEAIKFGIKRGTVIQAELKRTTTNADTDDVEIHLTEDVEGDLRRLPMGTILFGSKSFNAGTKRLDILCTSGITPDGIEFDGIKIFVRDEELSSGLAGTITEDKRIVERATSTGKFAFFKGMASGMSKTSPLGSALSESTESIIDQVEQVSQEKIGEMQNIITVNPRPVTLYVGGTF